MREVTSDTSVLFTARAQRREFLKIQRRKFGVEQLRELEVKCGTKSVCRIGSFAFEIQAPLLSQDRLTCESERRNRTEKQQKKINRKHLL